MIHKNNGEKNLKEFIPEGEAFHNPKVRCNKGGEFRSEKFKSWCKNKEIFLDYTIPYTL